ncbi:Hint domain-containing protein [Ruegeria sp. 6PALISEP08]|uniref:Hint domain-containing protein n=1 Tax=Ruegeria sp. 6PALISEP08 TaxID=1225660 RepID=UPI00067F3B13|nr:Hint domain-containing protein [Ruegeria sp. 6PALISEP08]
MVSVTITGELTGDVTGSPPNVAMGQPTLDNGTFTPTTQTWTIATPPANGTASIDPNTGEWTYTVDPTFFDSLDNGEIVFDTFFISVTGTTQVGPFTLPFSNNPDPVAVTIRIEGVCFAAGTLIETEDGPKVIETLDVSHKVATADHGLQPIRWIESSVIPPERLRDEPALQPVCISAGSLGPNTPCRDLLVSQQHRILVKGPKVELLFGAAEALVAAKHLCSWPGIHIDTSIETVEYLHILLDQHEILNADGAQAESLFLGEEALYTLSSDALSELAAIFPDRPTSAHTGFGRAARLILREHEARALA